MRSRCGTAAHPAAPRHRQKRPPAAFPARESPVRSRCGTVAHPAAPRHCRKRPPAASPARVPPVRSRCGTVAHPKAPRPPSPKAPPPLPEGSSPLDHQWLSHGSCERSLAVRALVRAPKEEQWIAIGQALRTNVALPHWPEKGKSRSAPPFPRRECRRRDHGAERSRTPAMATPEQPQRARCPLSQ